MPGRYLHARRGDWEDPLETLLEAYPGHYVDVRQESVDITEFGSPVWAIHVYTTIEIRGTDHQTICRMAEELIAILKTREGSSIAPTAEIRAISSHLDVLGNLRMVFAVDPAMLHFEFWGSADIVTRPDLGVRLWGEPEWGEDEESLEVDDARRRRWDRALDTTPSSTHEPQPGLTIDELLGEIDQTLEDYREN